VLRVFLFACCGSCGAKLTTIPEDRLVLLSTVVNKPNADLNLDISHNLLEYVDVEPTLRTLACRKCSTVLGELIAPKFPSTIKNEYLCRIAPGPLFCIDVGNVLKHLKQPIPNKPDSDIVSLQQAISLVATFTPPMSPVPLPEDRYQMLLTKKPLSLEERVVFIACLLTCRSLSSTGIT
jgi:hypothetical protein